MKKTNAKKAHQLRYQISTYVENEYARNTNNNSFISHTYSLLYYVMNKDEYYEEIFLHRMLPYVSHTEIDFYFFIEPHRIRQYDDDYLIPTDIIANWWAEKSDNNTLSLHSADTYKLIDMHLDKPIKKTTQNERTEIIAAVDECRYKVELNGPITITDAIIKQYIKAAETNSIGKINNIWPTHIASLYKKNKYKKPIEDEIRYIAFKQFTKIQNKFDVNEYWEWISVIANYFHQEPSEKKLRLLRPSRNIIDPGDTIREICTFVQSTYFMYTPMTKEESLNYDGVTDRPDVDICKDIWNIHLLAHNRMSVPQIIKLSNLSASVISWMRAMYEQQKNDLDPLLKNELAALLL